MRYKQLFQLRNTSLRYSAITSDEPSDVFHVCFRSSDVEGVRATKFRSEFSIQPQHKTFSQNILPSTRMPSCLDQIGTQAISHRVCCDALHNLKSDALHTSGHDTSWKWPGKSKRHTQKSKWQVARLAGHSCCEVRKVCIKIGTIRDAYMRSWNFSYSRTIDASRWKRFRVCDSP